MNKKHFLNTGIESTEEQYVAPEIEIIEMETSGVLAGSGDTPDLPGEDW